LKYFKADYISQGSIATHCWALGRTYGTDERARLLMRPARMAA